MTSSGPVTAASFAELPAPARTPHGVVEQARRRPVVLGAVTDEELALLHPDRVGSGDPDSPRLGEWSGAEQDAAMSAVVMLLLARGELSADPAGPDRAGGTTDGEGHDLVVGDRGDLPVGNRGDLLVGNRGDLLVGGRLGVLAALRDRVRRRVVLAPLRPDRSTAPTVVLEVTEDLVVVHASRPTGLHEFLATTPDTGVTTAVRVAGLATRGNREDSVARPHRDGRPVDGDPADADDARAVEQHADLVIQVLAGDVSDDLVSTATITRGPAGLHVLTGTPDGRSAVTPVTEPQLWDLLRNVLSGDEHAGT